jgi:hypothetical protein
MSKFSTDYIFNTATDTNGMNKNETVLFHRFNPNGLVAKLPQFEDFCHADVFFAGCEALYSGHKNYYAKWLDSVCHKPSRYSRWELAYHLNQLAKDVDKAWQVIAEKKAAA